eukprot:COSAG01_NODE_431_length_17124_cov_26.577386_27_plen_110_part_00
MQADAADLDDSGRGGTSRFDNLVGFVAEFSLLAPASAEAPPLAPPSSASDGAGVAETQTGVPSTRLCTEMMGTCSTAQFHVMTTTMISAMLWRGSKGRVHASPVRSRRE